MNNYSIDTKIAINERNQRRAHCIVCESHGAITTLERGEGYMVWIPNRGKRVVCERHNVNRGMLGYHGNSIVSRETLGSQKSTTLAKTTIGVEVECKNCLSDESFTALRALVESTMNVRMESDCTVSGEMPSAPMMGLARISKVLQSLEMHNQIDILSDPACGAHIHVYCNKVDYVRRYYHSIFIPLNNYIMAMDTADRVEIFGSDFRHWAMSINNNSIPTEHTNLFNTQHEHTLEFRLPRIIGYKQYMHVIKFWREVGCFINNFDFDMSNPSNDVRLPLAKQCGAELVEIAKKYF